MSPHNVGLFSPRLVIKQPARAPSDLHENAPAPIHSFALISPIRAANGRTSPRHNAAAHHRGGGGTRCPDHSSSHSPPAFQAPYFLGGGGGRWQAPLVPGTPQLDFLAVTKLSPAGRGGGGGKARGVLFWAGVYQAAMGKREASDSQWLLISSICSALGPTYLREKKQHVERKWQAETRSLAPPFSPRSVFKQGGPVTLKAPDQPHSIIAANPYSSIK